MITTTEHGPVVVLTMEHGKVNAMDVELCEELVARFASVRERPVVLTGAGRAFSAGVDLVRILDGGAAYVDRFIPALSASLEAVFAHPAPVVAAVNGAAIAGGCILACAADRRILASGAPIGATELQVGVPFPVAALEILRSACGERVEEVVLGAGLHRDEQAVALRLAHEVVAGDSLHERARAVAAELAALRPEAFTAAKLQLRRPALARIAADAPAVDPDVRREWASETTAAAIRAQMERTAAKSR